MAHVHRPSVPEDTDTLSIQGLSSRSSLLSLPAFDLEPDVHIVEGNASTPCSPAVSPQRGKERFDSLPPLPPNLTTSPRRSRSSSGTDNSVWRRRTLTVQHDQDPIPHLHLILAVATPYPQYVDSPLSSASSLLAPQPPSVPSFRTRPRALSDSHTSTSPPPRFSSLQARSHPATYLAYVLDLADSTSLFDSSDASDDDSVGASLGHDDLSDVEEDEDEDARDQDWVETSSLPSNSSSFHLAALFEEDSDEDEPSHVEHYFPPPTRSRTTTDPHGDDYLHRSDSTRGGTRTRVFPVVGDDDSSSDDDDSSEDEYERDSWRPMEVSGGGRINSLGLETNWSSPAEVLSPGFDAWRRQRDEARQREDQSFGRQFVSPLATFRPLLFLRLLTPFVPSLRPHPPPPTPPSHLPPTPLQPPSPSGHARGTAKSSSTSVSGSRPT